MITALYASLLMLLLMWLTVQVIKQRRTGKIAYADGGVKELQIARSAHGNATETIPISLILMILLELNGGNIYLLHVCGLVLLIGRILHGTGILNENFDNRKRGMVLTFVSQVLLIAGNLIYLPFDKIFG
ncbi:MAPEG family protein [Vibrio algarum]|uniref:MAPEG family protein n=1 Tax=Vibrio algarum TaxID=3020714 RepID=A0ABT4YR50_9VIBR|nr:MAPEG family protein [Vibrio sp. KJ40-1]MDB1123509.1 MAPEG family protein [Vibrio sp. KJ40-1]